MPLIPIAPPPGVCLSDSFYATGKDVAYVTGGGPSFRQGSGRWVDATNCEFVAGFPQKIAGWGAASMAVLEGIPRFEKIWRDNTGGARVGIGTETHLYYLLGSTITDITPLRTIATGTLTDPVTTTANSNIVGIADSSQNLVNGDWVFLQSATPVGGVLLNNWYQVSARTGSGYEITVPVAASGSAGPAGGSTAFQYPRVTLSNPFTTTTGLATVNVHHVASGAGIGEFVTYAGATAVGGLTINGEYQIQAIIDADNYTITAATPATSSAGPGGGSVSVIYDIVVPSGIGGTGVGYGVGAYGVGAYGLGITTNPILADGWTLDNYGNQLLAAPIGGTIYIYDPVFGGRAYPMLNAPATLLAMFVTPERFVVALGINGNLLEMAWCDQTDYTDWTTTPTNTANTGRTLIGGSYFTGGIGIRNGVSLIFTNKCCFEMTYTGAQEVYSTPQIGDNCGLVSPMAVCVEGGVAYWASDQDYWTWNGGVTSLPSDDIRAYVFQLGSGALNRQYIYKCATALNRAKKQVRFWFPGISNAENSQGVIFQYDQQCWSLMDFGKTCGVDAELLSTPVSSDTANLIYYDETGTDANGQILDYSLELNSMDISNGDKNADIFGFTPDFQALTFNATLTILTSFYPADIPQPNGVFLIVPTSGRIDTRANGKLFGFSIASTLLGATFRLGVPRLDVQPAGARN